jgi:pyruvate,water dikinase
MADRFPSPFEIETPAGAERWQDLYTYSLPFSEDRREYEDSMFWFQDGVHWPEVMSPWDATFYEFAIASLSQYNTRHYLIPPALGVDYRVLNGYAYLSPVGVADPAEIEARVPHFLERAGFYFQNWGTLYDQWMTKIRALIGEMEALRFEPLPDKEDLAVVTEGRGTGSGFELLRQYHRLLDLALQLWQYHFEFLNLGYAAYLDFFGFCKQAFPNIPDLAIAKMVAGVEVDLFQPDEELKKLARLAVDTGVDGAFEQTSAAATIEALRNWPTSAGRAWLDRWEAAAQPWFNFSAGSGFYHTDEVWLEHLEIPFGFIRDYSAKLRAGVDISRPVEAIRAERDRIVGEYSELFPTEDRAAFEAKLGLARVVFPYVENHNFYVEHWSHSVLWRKMRQLGGAFVKEGFFTAEDDVFLLKRDEVPEALWDMYSAWAVGVPPRGPSYWPRELERRKRIMAALRTWSPPPALGEPPEVVTEPFTIMLWGITGDSVRQWLGSTEDRDGGLKGFAASPGVAEGPARVIFSADQIGEVREGEILVAPLTAPSWAPIFGKIRATVTDVGGMMAHAAIVCREYGLPAVTGTAFGTKTIRNGQRIRVDGNNGTVTILS